MSPRNYPQVDRRANVAKRELLYPLVVALVVGLLFNGMNGYVVLQVMQEKMSVVSDDVRGLTIAVAGISANQVVLARHEVEIKNNEKFLVELAERVNDRYTAKDAEKDLKLVHDRIDHLHGLKQR